MLINVHCNCEDCYCNENGRCTADIGIEIVDGECLTREESEVQDADNN